MPLSAAGWSNLRKTGAWAPGYYSISFEDPDGIRLEINHVPGKGNLSDDAQLPLNERVAGGVSEQK